MYCLQKDTPLSKFQYCEENEMYAQATDSACDRGYRTYVWILRLFYGRIVSVRLKIENKTGQ